MVLAGILFLNALNDNNSKCRIGGCQQTNHNKPAHCCRQRPRPIFINMSDASIAIQQPQPGHPPPSFVPGPTDSVLPPNVPPQAAPPQSATDVAMAPPEDNACETLYIQNLNEKVKPQGMFLFNFSFFYVVVVD